MTEEQNLEIKEEKCNCICQSKFFKKFLVIASGSFVGVFCALSLFAALHRPPVAPCPFRGRIMPPPAYGCHHHFMGHRMYKGDFDKMRIQHRLHKKAPFERNIKDVNTNK